MINSDLPLYTSKIGFINDYSKIDFVKMLFGNLIGVTAIMFIAILCKNNLYETMVASAVMKQAIFYLHFYLVFYVGY